MNTKDNTLKFNTNPKIRVFIGLLFLSAIYWLFTSLSEKYNYTTTYIVSYKSIPKKLLFQSTPPSQISAQIEASGFEILSHKLHTKKLVFAISDFKPSGNYRYYYLPNTAIPILQKQLKETRLIHFFKDSVFVYLGALKTKKIPVVLDLDLQFKPGYKLTKALEVIPDSIEINGPEQRIDSVVSIKTRRKEVTQIDKNFSLNLSLDTLNYTRNRT